MLFSEKYEDNVRMIQFDNSKELCGGTHVSATGEIGLFKILTEASVSSGIRRIEAITGSVALEYFNKKESLIKEITDIVKNKDILNSVKQLVLSKKQLEKQVLEFKKISLLNIKSNLLNSSEKINKIRFIGKLVDMDADDMKNLSFSFKKEANLILVLGSRLTKKAILSVLITDDLVSNGLSAVNIIKEISKEIKGGGGGQPFFATAGGSDVNGIQSAIDRAKDLIK
jgi:alanyl-tRNA synthetase